MSRAIDERVVEMRFDNRRFESNVQTSMSTLDKLKQSLNLTGASKGLENVNEAAKNCNMSGLSTAVETVRMKFSALEVMAMTALANITNSAINAGKQMLRSLTVAPVSQGFEEYELKMGSIQTMMMSTGASLEEVNGYLDELNRYADKTIYSFSDMTSNIGKFTNAGVGLKESVMAIQGVSNVAAVSGANANEASRAMYNFAQALSSGCVRLIDWKSIENANMATVEFKNELIKTALATGTLIEVDGKYESTTKDMNGHVSDLFDATSNFNDSLSSQWMTTDVLVETLGRYADETTEIGKKSFAAAQDVKTFTQLMDTLQEAVGSGWATTWETVFGDFNEAKALWTEASQVIGGFIDAQSDARNEMLKGWKDLGGRTELIDAVKNAFGALTSVVKPIKEAFRDIFPAMTSERLFNLTKGLKEFTARLKLSKTASDNLKSTFKGLFAVLDIVKQAFGAIFRAISPLLGGVGDLGGGILGLTGSLGDGLVRLDEWVRKSDIFNKAIQGVIGFVRNAINAFKDFAREVGERLHLPSLKEIKESIKDFLNIFKEKFKAPALELIQSLLERIRDRASQVGEAAGNMKDRFLDAVGALGDALSKCKFTRVLEAIWGCVKRIGSGISDVFGNLMGGVIDKLGNANFSGILDFLNTLSIGGIAFGIGKFIKGFNGILEAGEGFKEHLIGILDGVRGCLESFQTQLKAGALRKIATAIAILAGSILVLSLIDSDKLAVSLAAITGLFADMMGSLAILGKLNGLDSSTRKSMTSMVVMSVAILILAGAMKKLADLEWEGIAKGITGIFGITTILVAAAKIMDSGGKKITKFAGQMVIMSVAIGILSKIAESLSQFSWEELGKAGAGILGLTTILVAAAKIMDSGKKKITKFAGQMVIMSVAIGILSKIAESLSQFSWEELGKAGAGILGLTTILVAAAKIMDSGKKKITKFAGQMVIMSVAIGILSKIAESLSQFSWEELGKAGAGILGVTTILVAAAKIMDGGKKKITKFAGQMVIMSVAIGILSKIAESLSQFSWEELGKAGAGILGITTILVAAAKIMGSGGKKITQFAGQMVIMSAAIRILTPALVEIGNMSWESIAKGLVTLAGAFAVIGIAGAVLKPLIPAIIGLSGAIALLGIGVLGVGAGLWALSSGIAALSTAGTVGATTFVAAMTIIVTGIAGMIPAVAVKLAEGVVEFCRVIGEGAPIIGKAIKELVLVLIDVMTECIPQIVDAVFQMVTKVLDALIGYTPQIVDQVFKFLVNVLEGVARNLPQLIQAVVDVLMALFSGVIDALGGIDFDVMLKGIAGVGLLSVLMRTLSSVAAMTPSAMLGVLGIGAVLGELSLVLAAFGALNQIPGLSWLIKEGGDLLQDVGTAIGKFVGGIVGGFMGGISSSFPQIGKDLSDFLVNAQPFIDGASKIDASMMEGAKALAETILTLTKAEILDALTSWLTGGSSLAKFAEDLVPFGEAMKEFSLTLTGMDTGIAANAATAGKTLAEMAATLPNSGGVLGFFAGENDMGEFADQLIPFGKAIKAFSVEVAGLDGDVVNNAATAGKTLAEMASTLPNSGGVLGFFAGENDMDMFADQLVPFGKAIREFADAVVGLDGEAVENAAVAGEAMAKMAETIPNTGGVVDFFAGSNDMDEFGDQLVPFGNAMKEFAASVSGIDTDAVTSAATAGEALASMADTLPRSGGVVDFFAGGNDMDEFGDQLIPFGKGMKEFADSVSGIDTDAVTSAATAGEALASMADTLPNSGGVVDFFAGNNNIDEFGERLISFGENFAKYSDAMKGVDSGIVTATADAAASIVELQKSLPKEGGWFSDDQTLADFGDDMAAFGEYFADYYSNISNIDPSQLSGITDELNGLVGIVGSMSEIDTSVIKVFAEDLPKFGEQLVPFGKAMKEFSISVTGLETAPIYSAVYAGKALAGMAEVMPKYDGLVSFFAGNSNLTAFGDQLISFGKAMKEFSVSVTDLETAPIYKATAAGIALAGMAEVMPNCSGLVSFFNGEGNMEAFGNQLVPFGRALKDFSVSVTDLETAPIYKATYAGKALAEMSKTIPNCNNLISFFSGSGNMEAFGNQLKPFGKALKDFSDSVDGLEKEPIEKAADAGTALAEMSKTIPNCDNLIGFFNGAGSMETFGNQLKPFGKALKDFSDSVDGLKKESIDKAAEAGTALAEMSKTIPNCNNLISFFNGSGNMETFGNQLKPFGKALKDFSDSVDGLEKEPIEKAAEAGTALAEMSKTIPNCSNLVSFFSGTGSMEAFGNQLKPFGKALKDFSDSVDGLEKEPIEKAADAGTALAEMSKTIPNCSNLVSFFNGAGSMEAFGNQLKPFGKALKDFSDSVDGLEKESIEKAADAGTALAEMSKTIPNCDNLVSFFNGAGSMEAFGNQLKPFGKALKDFSDAVEGLNKESIEKAADAGTALAEMSKTIPNCDGLFTLFGGNSNMETFGKQLTSFGEGLVTFSNDVSGIDTGKLATVITQMGRLVEIAQGLSGLDTSAMGGFANGLTELGKAGLDSFIATFDNSASRVQAAAAAMMDNFIGGVESKQNALTMTFTTLVASIKIFLNEKAKEFKTSGQTIMTQFIDGVKSREVVAKYTFMTVASNCLAALRSKYLDFETVGRECVDKLTSAVKTKEGAVKVAFVSGLSGAVNGIRGYYDQFREAGSYLVEGFARGITINTYKAEARSREMAAAAVRGAREELDEHSPSKVGYEIGDFFGVAFVGAIGDYGEKAYEAGSGMGDSAKSGLGDAISKIRDLINGSMDFQPTIRPVLDLTDVVNGVNQMNGLLKAERSLNLAVKANVGSDKTTGYYQNAVIADNRKMMETVTALRADVASLAESIRGLKVVMDTGTLVGTLTDPMNAALGRRAIYEGRGI